MSFFSTSTETQKKVQQTERIARITEKLNMINLANNTNKNKKINGLQEKIFKLEDKIIQYGRALDLKIVTSRQTIQSIKKKTQDLKYDNEKQHDKRMQNIAKLQQNMIELLDSQREIRKETESHLIRIIEDKTQMLSEDINRGIKLRESIINQVNNALSCEIPKIHELIDIQAKERQQKELQIKEKLQQQVRLLHSKLEVETKSKQTQEQAIFDKFSNIVNTIKQKFEIEKSEMNKGEQKLLLVLKQACAKIEINSSKSDIEV